MAKRKSGSTPNNINSQHADKSEALFKSVFNQQFHFVALLEPNGKIVEINDLPLKVLNEKRSDYIGKLFWETSSWKPSKEWQSIIKSQVLKAAKSEEPILTEDAVFTSDGQKRYAMASYSAIRNKSNDVKYVLVQAQDITERIQMEKELKETKEELTTLVNQYKASTSAAKVGIWDWDIQNNVLAWDDAMCEMYDSDQAHFDGTYEFWKSKVHHDDIDRTVIEINMALSGEKPFDTEFRIFWQDGSIHYIRAQASVQHDANGAPIRLMGTNWDVTKEKELEENERFRFHEIERQHKELEEFTFIVSHDLQEPLFTMMSYVDILNEEYHEKIDENGQKYLDYICNASRQMSALFKGLLDYSKIGQSEEMKRVDLNVIIGQVLDDLKLPISQAKASFEISKLPIIQGYELELRVLFYNIVSNAIKFRNPSVDLNIRIHAIQNKKDWKISVTDNGIGIEQNHKEKVFEIFKRLHSKSKYEGVGIGLSLCHKIIEMHHGMIWIDSKPNSGTTVNFTLPYSQ